MGDDISCGSKIAMGSPNVDIGAPLGALGMISMFATLAGSLSNLASSLGLNGGITAAATVGANGEIGAGLLSTSGGLGIAPDAVSTIGSGFSLPSIPTVGDVLGSLGISNPLVSNAVSGVVGTNGEIGGALLSTAGGLGIPSGFNISDVINGVVTDLLSTKITDLGSYFNGVTSLFGADVANQALTQVTRTVAAKAPDVVAAQVYLPTSFINFIASAYRNNGNYDLKISDILKKYGVIDPYVTTLVFNNTDYATGVNNIIRDIYGATGANILTTIGTYESKNNQLLTLALLSLNNKIRFFNPQQGSILNLPAHLAGNAAQAASANAHGLSNGQQVRVTQGGLGA
jgi:hypothetical protein